MESKSQVFNPQETPEELTAEEKEFLDKQLTECKGIRIVEIRKQCIDVFADLRDPNKGRWN